MSSTATAAAATTRKRTKAWPIQKWMESKPFLLLRSLKSSVDQDLKSSSSEIRFLKVFILVMIALVLMILSSLVVIRGTNTILSQTKIPTTNITTVEKDLNQQEPIFSSVMQPCICNCSSEQTTSAYASRFPWASRFLASGEAGYKVADFLASYSSEKTKFWAPAALNRCQKWMPFHFAPCLYPEDPGFYGEQMLYPDFDLRMPFFITRVQRRNWIEHARRARIWYSSLHVQTYRNMVTYQGQDFGQNIVFANGLTPPELELGAGTWHSDLISIRHSKGSCFGSRFGDHSIYKSKTNEVGLEQTVDQLVVAHVPDFGSFQHFHDRALVVAMQSLHLRESDESLPLPSDEIDQGGVGWTARQKERAREFMNRRKPRSRIRLRTNNSFIMGAPSARIKNEDDKVAMFRRSLVDEVGDLFGYDPLHRIEPKAGVRARELYYSCRTVEMHPYFIYRFRDILGVDQAAPTQEDIDNNVMNFVVYLSRSSTAANGRNVKNEKQLLDALHDLLHERNKNESLVLLDAKLSYAQTRALFHNAKCLIGLHGGSFYNQRYARPHTLIVEFMPKPRFKNLFYEASMILSQPYFPLLYDSENLQNDVTVDIEEVLLTTQFALSRYAGTYGMDQALKDEMVKTNDSSYKTAIERGGDGLFNYFGPTLLRHYDNVIFDSMEGNEGINRKGDDPRFDAGYHNITQYDLDMVKGVLVKNNIPITRKLAFRK